MRHHEFRLTTGRRRHLLQNLHYSFHSQRRVSGLRHELQAEHIRLAFVVAGELKAFHLSHDAADGCYAEAAGRVVAIACSNRDGGEQFLHELRFGHLLRRVTANHMPAFVTENAGQLGFAAKTIEQAAGDENLAAGKGKGIDGFCVAKEMELKLIGALGGGTVLHDAPADALDFQRLRIVGRHFAAHLRRHSRRRLQAKLNFLAAESATCCFSPVTGFTLVRLE